jgi:hypothetical protein
MLIWNRAATCNGTAVRYNKIRNVKKATNIFSGQFEH